MHLSTITSIVAIKESLREIGEISHPHCKADDDELGKAFRDINKLAETSYKILEQHPAFKELNQ